MRQIKLYSKSPFRSISINAPLRSATYFCLDLSCGCYISINAPLRSATPQKIRQQFSTKFQSTHPYGVRRRLHGARKWIWNFNQRTPTECDLSKDDYIKLYKDISINAPLRSATLFSVKNSPLILFQSTHPYGVRRAWGIACEILQWFQSTHPYGVRQIHHI